MKFLSIFLVSLITIVIENTNPIPPNGLTEFSKFIDLNFKENRNSKKIEGSIILRVHIQESGKIDSVHIVQDSKEKSADNLILFVMKAGDWTPSYSSGKPKASWMLLTYESVSNQNKLKINNYTTASPTLTSTNYKNTFLKNFMYGEKAQAAGIQGTFTLNFIVKEDGSLTSITMPEDPGYNISENAIRALKKSGKWIPATIDGVPTKSKEEFSFTLQLKNFRRGVY